MVQAQAKKEAAVQRKRIVTVQKRACMTLCKLRLQAARLAFASEKAEVGKMHNEVVPERHHH